jgi:hypothetical protein
VTRSIAANAHRTPPFCAVDSQSILRMASSVTVTGFLCVWTLALGGVAEPTRSHPWLFLSAEHIARSRAAMAADDCWARIAARIRERAESTQPADLPPLERGWWNETRHQPWSGPYPLINQHTGKVPRAWARLAHDCATAAALLILFILSPSMRFPSNHARTGD